MSYVPVANRQNGVTTGYVPVAERTKTSISDTLPIAPSLFSLPTSNQSTLDIAPQTGGGLIEGVKSTVRGLIEQYTKPSPETLRVEKAFGVGQHAPIPASEPSIDIGTIAQKAFIRTFAPVVTSLGKNIGERILLRELTPKIQSGEIPASVINEFETLNKTAPQIVGDVAQAVLAVYSPTMFARQAFLLKNSPIQTALLRGGIRGTEAGLGFGVAGALSSGTKDPVEFAQVVGQSIATLGVLGAITSGVIPVTKGTLNKFVEVQNKLEQELISRGYSPTEAKALAQRGGFAGKLPEKPKPVEPVGFGETKPTTPEPLAQEAPKSIQPLLDVAKKYPDIKDFKLNFSKELENPKVAEANKMFLNSSKVTLDGGYKDTTIGNFRKVNDIGGYQALHEFANKPEIPPTEITPTEIKAKIRGEAPKIKTSGEQFAPEMTKSQLIDISNEANKGEIPKSPEPPIKRPPSLEKLGLKEKPNLITKREDVLLREKLRTQASSAKNAIAQYKRATRILDSISSEITKELNKPKGIQRSTISFVKQLGEFNQTVMNEVKTELGIEKPLKEMNLTELNDFTTKLKERLKFKFEKGYTPSIETKEKLNLKESPKPTLNEVDYEKNRQFTKESKSTIKKDISGTIEKTIEGGGKILAPISTRLGNIDPSLKFAMRKFEFNVMNTIQNGKKAIEPYLKKVKTGLFGKMTKDDFADLDLALKNGDIEKIGEINKKYGIEKEYNEVHKTLDDIYKRANEVGFDIGYQKDYWPRTIKDTEGFLEYFGKQEYWSILNESIQRKEMDLGRYLTSEEKANLINTMIRGYQGGQITLSGTGAMKSRVVDLVTPELNQFYYNSPTSLVKYIEGVNDKIAARKFFGKGNKAEGFNNVEDSIGAYTTDLLAKGKITPKQELELRGMLNARFNPKGTHGIVGLYKNLSYIDVMGSFLNAVTQLGDQAWAIYRGGLWGTIKADIKVVFGKSVITKETLGIEANKVASEFSDAGKTAKAVDKVFTMTGLNKIDRLGKEALVNGAIEKYRELAQKPTVEFLKKLDDIFGKESEQVLTDLKSGELTENVKLLAFNELLDFHPVALSEMPEAYLKAGNGRIFYMLKSYTLKQFDIFRREAFAEMKKGNWWKGIKNLLYLSSLVILTNGAADEIKDLLTNRKTKLSDRVIDQLAMLAGFSRYNLGKISEVGLGSALTEQITPPTNFIDNMSKDLINLYKDFDKSADINQLKTVQDIPLIGKFYYWWLGKGAENTKKYAPKESKFGAELPSLPKLPQLPALPKLPSFIR